MKKDLRTRLKGRPDAGDVLDGARLPTDERRRPDAVIARWKEPVRCDPARSRQRRFHHAPASAGEFAAEIPHARVVAGRRGEDSGRAGREADDRQPIGLRRAAGEDQPVAIDARRSAAEERQEFLARFLQCPLRASSGRVRARRVRPRLGLGCSHGFGHLGPHRCRGGMVEVDESGRSGGHEAVAYRTAMSSTRKWSVAFPGITGGAPRAP